MDYILFLNQIFDNIFKNDKNLLDTNLLSENDYGNIEYKRSIKSYNTTKKKNKLLTQILWRISEGLTLRNEKICRNQFS